ncbi:glutamate racemase [Marinomonas flavescens]|uniref:glutamate racemase n=1 Tax=Marinomonas flavescens TaxID=2529379 RepID=UPI0010548D44|nr:glutamate racemase [Marinomonas flavescens]
MKIGVMDSGAGGITILNTIRQKIPMLDLVYLADEFFAPYGERSPADIQSRVVSIGCFFESQNVDAIVVACNTATVIAIDALRARIALPVIGVEPAVKPAFRVSKTRHVAVLATPLTAHSQRLKELISLWREDSNVHIMSSSTLAFDIDAWPQSKVTVEETVKNLCLEMIESGIDTLVLACTHYPLIKKLFAVELGPDCEIIEPSEGVVAQLVRRLNQTYPTQFPAFLSSVTKGSIEVISTKGLDNMDRLTSWIEDRDSIAAKKSINLSA